MTPAEYSQATYLMLCGLGDEAPTFTIGCAADKWGNINLARAERDEDLLSENTERAVVQLYASLHCKHLGNYLRRAAAPAE